MKAAHTCTASCAPNEVSRRLRVSAPSKLIDVNQRFDAVPELTDMLSFVATPPTIGDTFRHWRSVSRVASSDRWATPCEFDQLATAAALKILLTEEYDALPTAAGPHDRGRYEAMNDVFAAVRADVLAVLNDPSAPPWGQLLGFVLLLGASVRLAGIAIDRGDLRATRRALLEPLTASEESVQRESALYFGRVLVLAHPDQPLPDSIVVEPLLRWSELVFVCERFRGWFGSLADELYRTLEPWVLARLGVDDEFAYLALAMAQWAARRNFDDGQLMAGIAELRESGRLPEEAEPAFAILDTHRLTAQPGQSAATQALTILDAFEGRLTGTEMFQLVGLACHNTSIAVDDHANVLAAIEALMRDWRQTTPDALFMADRRGAHFPLMGNVAISLLQHGRADLLGPTLGAWMEIPPRERRRDLLYWIVSGEPGIGWAFDRHVRLIPDVEAVLSYVNAIGKFLNLRLATLGVESPDLLVTPRGFGEPGFPNDGEGLGLQTAMRPVLGLDQLSEVLTSAAPARPSAMVLLQDVGTPLQPFLLREFGQTFPWSVSLRAPHPDRPIKRAAVVLTGTELGRIEIDGVAAVLRAGGVDVVVVDEPHLNVSAFTELYIDPSFDVLWVVGHGIYDHDDPGRSHLPMPDDTRVTVADLERCPPSIASRRLLVLNLCDAATSLIAGGPPEFGLGLRAAGPSQACIGHRWPVVAWPDAILIGRLLAEDLLRERTFFDAYCATVTTLLGGSEAIRERLTGLGGELDDQLRAGLGSYLAERPNLLSMWGSLAFLE